MDLSKRDCLTVAVVTLMLGGSMVLASCTGASSENSTSTLPNSTDGMGFSDGNSPPTGMPPGTSLPDDFPGNGTPPEGVPQGKGFPAEAIAEILGIEQQEVENAFAQAQAEINSEDSEDRESNELMDRVAEILNIDRQTLEDALIEALGNTSDGNMQQESGQ